MTDRARLVGVYHADGGLVGELRYAWLKVTGQSHCELCDLTHRGVRRRPDWDATVATLGLPVDLVHRNERSEAVRAASGDATPCVLLQDDDGVRVLLGPADLAPLDGDLDAFAALLRTRLAADEPGTLPT